ncbi:hypothetical protein QU481_10250 [Crenobacter sp. SG2303]|uniref:Transposase n=1 Tax=Crenobacter oryzisoli TaxID=3056844 RepID=A0ABT7XN96_9NEIS|nr:hypothetical protein [Crenobacter sp. SG2303]
MQQIVNRLLRLAQPTLRRYRHGERFAALLSGLALLQVSLYRINLAKCAEPQ